MSYHRDTIPGVDKKMHLKASRRPQKVMNKISSEQSSVAAYISKITKMINTNIKTKFTLKPLFGNVINSLSEANTSKYVFTYEEIGT